MEVIRLHKVVEKDGEITLTGLPCKQGQQVEMILLIEPPEGVSEPEKPRLRARDLLNLSIVGMWADREDIGDSSVFARQLREQA